jgi:hypothetical protein
MEELGWRRSSIGMEVLAEGESMRTKTIGKRSRFNLDRGSDVNSLDFHLVGSFP